jgi:hypothetical protein
MDETNKTTGEAAQYMERLVREYLGTILDGYEVEEHPLRDMDDATFEFSLAVVIGALEADKEVVLACLLKAAVSVSKLEDGSEEGATMMKRFLRRSIGTILQADTTQGITFLQTILEELLARDDLDGHDTSSLDDSSVGGPILPIIVAIGMDTIEVPFHGILSCFWKTRLDTDCQICQQPFLNEPPIRTFAKIEPDSKSPSKTYIRVFNRHYACLEKNKTFFVPVSHVWEESIRLANESKCHNNEAASTLINTLESLLQGVEDAYDPGVEFWHDYFSVPQWVQETKESLLLCLPAIYYLAEEILVHMSDFPSHQATSLLVGNLIGSEVSLLEAMKRIHRLRTLANAEWMQRMWVLLEYSQSKAACFMDRSNKIHRYRSPNGLWARNTFSQLVDCGHNQLIGLFRYAKTFSRSLSRPGEFLSGLSYQKSKERRLCLGEVLELIARKQCQVFRDRFLAMHIVLNGIISPLNPPAIPKNEEHACGWVWRSALEKGDYSPILLQPQERFSLANPRPELASWMVGFRSLDDAEWQLGNEITSPRYPPILTSLGVETVMDHVGEIEKIHFLGVEESGEVEGVCWAIDTLSSISESERAHLSPKGLVDGLNRVFPFDANHKKAAWALEKMVLSFDELVMQNDTLEDKLDIQIESYTVAREESQMSDMQDIAAEVSRMLKLEKHIFGETSDQITRLTVSRHLARQRKVRGAKGGEPICEVRCPKCHNVTLFRLDLRETAQIGDKVYRIPELGYSGTVENGVGLVINDGRITGRMLYGPPACDCQVSCTVQIK